MRMAGGSPRLGATALWAWLLLLHNNPKMEGMHYPYFTVEKIGVQSG